MRCSSLLLLQVVVTSTWSFDKFKAAIAEAGDLAAIAEPNLKVSDNSDCGCVLVAD